QRSDNRVHPLARVEQFAPVERETGGGRAEGGTELVGAQHQVRRQTGGEQGRGGEQAATASDGIDKAGDEGNKDKDGEGDEVYAEFERHGIDLLGGAQKRMRERRVS